MSSAKEVVVLTRAEFYYHKTTGEYAARIRPLGLTTYGDTPDKAYQKLKQAFCLIVNARHQQDSLESWLNSSGVSWYWKSDHDDKFSENLWELVQAYNVHQKPFVCSFD